MGGANNICSDKTGTLTENIMKVTRVWVGKELDEISQERKAGGAKGELCNLNWGDLGLNLKFVPFIEQAIALNTADQMGATDKALDEFIVRCGADKPGLKKKHFPGDATKLIRFPFSSVRKRMSTIIENATGAGGYDRRIFIKGASEIVMECCSQYMDDQGNVMPLNDVVKGTLNNVIVKFAQ